MAHYMMCCCMAAVVVGVFATGGAEGELCGRPASDEDAALLQFPRSLESGADPVSCLHGTRRERNSRHGYVCDCTQGWAGEDCSKEEELHHEEDEPVFVRGDDELCTSGGRLQLFPYAEQAHWGTNFVGWEQCAGKRQSPIDLRSEIPALGSGRFTQALDREEHLNVQNNGHAIQITSHHDFGTVTVDGTVFTAKQFHFHSPSEHSVDGMLAVVEMHVVAVNSDRTAAAVVSIFFDVGESNACLEKVFNRVCPRAGCTRYLNVADLSCFQEQLSGNRWNYQGSLTTPPCSEIVNWNVMTRRATLSWSQLAHFTKRFPTGNNRDVQPLNGRDVHIFKP